MPLVPDERRYIAGVPRIVRMHVSAWVGVVAIVGVTSAIFDEAMAQTQPFIRFSADITGERTETVVAPADAAQNEIVVTSHISAYSQQTSFGGDVVSHLDVADSRFQPLWSEPVCHQDRGFPRVDVTHVAGARTTGTEVVDATKRVIGRPVPSDELYLDQRSSSYSGGQKLYYYRTRASRFMITIRLTRRFC